MDTNSTSNFTKHLSSRCTTYIMLMLLCFIKKKSKNKKKDLQVHVWRLFFWHSTVYFTCFLCCFQPSCTFMHVHIQAHTSCFHYCTIRCTIKKDILTMQSKGNPYAPIGTWEESLSKKQNFLTPTLSLIMNRSKPVYLTNLDLVVDSHSMRCLTKWKHELESIKQVNNIHFVRTKTNISLHGIITFKVLFFKQSVTERS